MLHGVLTKAGCKLESLQSRLLSLLKVVDYHNGPGIVRHRSVNR